jgi:hypothetical protein
MGEYRLFRLGDTHARTAEIVSVPDSPVEDSIRCPRHNVTVRGVPREGAHADSMNGWTSSAVSCGFWIPSSV